MNYLLRVKIVHPGGDLLGPRHHPIGGDDLLLLLEEVGEGAVGAELHDDAEARGLRAHPFELDDVGVVEFAQVSDVGFFDVEDLLDGDGLVVEHAGEDDALAAAAEVG